jgi:hypothetical protein
MPLTRHAARDIAVPGQVTLTTIPHQTWLDQKKTVAAADCHDLVQRPGAVAWLTEGDQPGSSRPAVSARFIPWPGQAGAGRLVSAKARNPGDPASPASIGLTGIDATIHVAPLISI